VATPYAKPPRSARLRVFETKEVADLIFAWWGIEDREPQWRLPADSPDQNGWSNLIINTLRFPGHPQETTENSVDLGHLRYVHGYNSVKRAAKLLVAGHRLESDFDFKRTQVIAKVAKFTTVVSAKARIYGLGYSYVRIREHTIGTDLRLWVLATPVDGTLIDLSLVSQVREIRKPRRWIAGMGFLPISWRAPVMNKLMSTYQHHDVLQDLVIWEKKRYIHRPLLCRSDGEIMRFRRYCAQFYPSPDEPASPVTVRPFATAK
jgi:hypothetical protein